ncbi:cation diffusion facilitator family transporter [Ectothiorhodospira lacustris]|uniref:cation diffusion facilitator family transporter n=1 Tax=Ectothiorhodospira lacustris TaxID=2899127 RepID=UPI001EE7DC89|nr:cation diffusion facilitator family transporter [Ectothiorhodospira lacustris]MCG5499678.1 cation diffusion facilitator family transporter [Ectothiorhodospira lacustris]MCG5509084.1 cation diffusion facilitator family transporter [Ectothiorhodospira lacustris]MCG5520875.1 cation diffusion facilitator family transporter [Ectothiorhodospira lacustris]
MSAGLPSEQRYQAMRRVTLIGAMTNVSLATAQIVGGWMSHSQALIADGVHTLSDLISDIMVLFAARKANEAADANHPYGHGRIETLATVAVGLILAGVAVGIMADAARRLLNPAELLNPTPLALVLAAIAIISKEALYHYTMRVAKKVRSRMLEANAWHHRSDVISSVVVLVGVGATLAGMPFMDAVAAILVALLIGHMGVKLIWNSARELIDTGVEAEEQERMLEAVRRLDGIQGVHDLRTRRMAGTLLADVHVQVAPRISVSEGHHIADAVCVAMHGVQDELGDILVHIDPEDDQQSAPSSHLPNRTEMLKRLQAQWHDLPASRHVDQVIIHYLQGRVHLELQLPLQALDNLTEADSIARALVASSLQAEDVGQVQVLFRH